MKRISIIPPIPLTTFELERRKDQYTLYAGTNIEIDIRILKGGPLLTDSEEDLFIASKFMIAEAVLSEKEGTDAIVIDCTTDPGMLEMEKLLTIPITGSLKHGILWSKQRANNYSVLALDNIWAKMISNKINEYKMIDNLISVESVGMHIYNPNHKETMNESEFQTFFSKLLEAGNRAVKKGANSLILGSTTVIKGWKELEQELGIPVTAPGIAALKAAERMISNS